MHCGLQRRRNESLFLQTQEEKTLDSQDIGHLYYEQWLQLSWTALLSLFPARPVWRRNLGGDGHHFCEWAMARRF